MGHSKRANTQGYSLKLTVGGGFTQKGYLFHTGGKYKYVRG